ncbi:cytochrome c biogenesis protein [Fontivita pretiosa]|uniref:cytochrome c biogenesis protein n=1 Tax=Fontivita pretiosa TaxID=2989684 RepID=UPI003D1793C3
MINAGYWILTLLLTAAAVAMLAFYTPDEATMGSIQKIFYLHLPAAICTFLACLVCFVASIGYLTQRRNWWDDLAAASGRVAVQLCSIVLITGMIWGRSAWGQWWTWSPRLTFSLILWLLYVVYLMIRTSIESPQRRAVISAVYAIIAFLDVPLVYLSTRLMVDIHPTSITLATPMKLTLAVWFVPIVLLSAGLIMARFRLNQYQRTLAPPARIEPGHSGFQWAAGEVA